ncbi:MAG TPA: hypothetical protein VGK00_13640 [Anaerolineales bacterium]|jgi:hypothetical protein
MISNARPKTITVIIAMLLLLALLSTFSLVTNRLAIGAPNRQFASGANQGQGFNGNLQGNNGNFQGNNGNLQGGFGANRRVPGGLNLFSLSRSIGLSGPVVIFVSLGFSILGILLLLASAYGVWKAKRWGLNLGTLLGLVFLVGALPGLFFPGGRNINWLRMGTNILSAVATLPILALSLLPSVRDHFPRSAPKARK